MRLKNRIAIVTGGGSGLGAGIAERFAEEGARLVLADLNGANAEAVAEKIRQGQAEAIGWRGCTYGWGPWCDGGCS